ncbi:MAG TPA: glycosyltransferase family 2 protein [Natronosporangium sp.]
MSKRPDVTVVVGAYNAMPYLTKCLSSVVEQSIGPDRLELIAIDDGSTDGTGAELDRFAAAYPSIRVIHQENSGGPAGPRNRGIELARGRYLFFLDADDYLGPEALERLVTMADRNRSDVVLGKRVGVNRGTPQWVFAYNRDRADLFSSPVWQVLSAQKLFRKALIDRLGLRFPELPIGQDQPFTALAYLHAEVISVLGDYDCYYLVRRDDGGNNTTRQKDIRVWLRFLETMFQLVAEHVPAGERRDFLLQRQFRDELRRLTLAEPFLAAEPPVRSEAVERVKALLDAYYTPRIAAAMPPDGRLKFELVSRGDLDRLRTVIERQVAGEPGPDIVDKGRLYANLPYFRDVAANLPDELYDHTGQVLRIRRVRWSAAEPLAVELAGGRTAGPVTVKLTGTGDRVYRIPAERTDGGGFVATVRLATAANGRPLPAGQWRVEVDFDIGGTGTFTVPAPRQYGMRPRLWWRRGLPVLVGPRRWTPGPLTLAVAPVISLTTARSAAGAVRRRLGRLEQRLGRAVRHRASRRGRQDDGR